MEALQPVCAPFTEAEDYRWFIYVREQMVKRYGTAEQMEGYRRQAELRGTPECKAKTHTGKLLFYQSCLLYTSVYFQKHAPKEMLKHWNILVGRQPLQNIGLVSYTHLDVYKRQG